MAEANIKQCYVKTDPTFEAVHGWMTAQRAAGHLNVTGYCTIDLNHICGLAANELYWANDYHFCRTAAATIRYLMLRVAGIQDFYPHHFNDGKQHHRNVIDQLEINGSGIGINHENHLAATANEAKTIVGYFDMLFSHVRFMNRIRGILEDVVLPMTDRMIVIDWVHRVGWDFHVGIQFCRLGDHCYRAIPSVTVLRFQLTDEAEPVPNPYNAQVQQNAQQEHDEMMAAIQQGIAALNIQPPN